MEQQAPETLDLRDLDLQSVVLASAHFTRTTGELSPGPIEVQIESTFDDNDSSTVINTCTVSFAGTETDSPIRIETSYLVRFESSEINFDDELIQEALAPLSMRISYPYHRQMVGQFISQSGLPPLSLPLVPDDRWRDMESD